MIEKVFAGVAAGLLCILLVGCGDDNPLGRRPISGDVLFDGQPMETGSISFRPQGKGGIGSGAPIKDGRYQIEMTKGLPPSEYIVRINSPVRFGDEIAPTGAPSPESLGLVNGVERVPEEYNSKSTLRAVVTAKGDNKFDYDIETK